MADAPELKLNFRGTCPDCGVREVHLPAPLADAGDDFDWQVRDYNGFRMFMLEELAARFPERKRWTPADLEVVLVEVMATILDQLSDMLDRVAAEAYLETARKPENVRQLLEFIGYDAVAVAKSKDQLSGELQGDTAVSALEDYWSSHPHAMVQAKRDGPWDIHTQKRMVTTDDYALRLREHPLVVNAHAWTEWSGSWFTLHLAVIVEEGMKLDPAKGVPPVYNLDLKKSIINFHERVGLVAPNLETIPPPSVRMILRPYTDAFRMVGQEVILRDPQYIGIYMAISIKISNNHFQSEIRHAIAQVLGQGPDGFFAPGRHGFGEDLYSSDVIEILMALDGVENVCLNRFKRIGNQYLNRVDAGFIILDGLEVAVCDNNAGEPERGYYRLKLHGGRRG
ncbi:MAG: hypothetical protein GY806_21805 [Gammaproteobacteria bacterium]|nr:hypothetical protein [Gammaproteobacteria bacterium]